MVDAKGVRKFLVLGILGLFMISMMAGVLAENGKEVGKNIGELFGETGKGVIGFLEGFFGGNLLGDGILTKIFMSLLLAMFVYTAMGTFFGDNKPVLWTATISVTVLAVIGLPAGFC